MSNLEVVFNVPEFVDAGLNNGSLERIGGVIVDRSSKQVVTWLRDGSQLTETTPDILGGLANIAAYTATGQVLNLAVTSATFHVMIQRLDALSGQIAQLREDLQAQFDRDRDVNFKVALVSASDIFESDDVELNKSGVRKVIDDLYTARENFLRDFNDTLKLHTHANQLTLAQHYLIRAMYADTCRIRCYLATNQRDLALKRLKESIIKYEEYSRNLVEKWLGDHPAIFLYKDVPLEDMQRFLRVWQWLWHDTLQDASDQTAVLARIIDDLRVDFWNADIIQDEYGPDVFRRLTRNPDRRFHDRILELSSHLTEAELVIENFHRLQGFELELRSMRLSFHEWNHLVDENQNMGFIVDQDVVTALGLAG